MRRNTSRLINALAAGAVIGGLAAGIVALHAAFQSKVQAAVCMENQKQMGAVWFMYAQDYDEHVVPLASAAPAPAAALFPAAHTWWPDLLSPYTRSRAVFQCPGCKEWGIGMNRPEVGRWLKKGPSLSDFGHLPETVVFADAGRIANPGEPDPDAWRETPGRPALYFRTPNDLPLFNTDPQRVIGRHEGKVIVLYADGHARGIHSSELGLQYPKGDPHALWDLK
jgi:prepilin-type processing-associated H-X9-DG protein